MQSFEDWKKKRKGTGVFRNNKPFASNLPVGPPTPPGFSGPQPAQTPVQEADTLLRGYLQSRTPGIFQDLFAGNQQAIDRIRDLSMTPDPRRPGEMLLPQFMTNMIPRQPTATATVRGQQFSGTPDQVAGQIGRAQNAYGANMRLMQLESTGQFPEVPPFVNQPAQRRSKSPLEKRQEFYTAVFKDQTSMFRDAPPESAQNFFDGDAIEVPRQQKDDVKEPGFFAQYDKRVKEFRKDVADALTEHGAQPFESLEDYTDFIQSLPTYSPLLKKEARKVASQFMPKELKKKLEDQRLTKQLHDAGYEDYTVLDGKPLRRELSQEEQQNRDDALANRTYMKTLTSNIAVANRMAANGRPVYAIEDGNDNNPVGWRPLIPANPEDKKIIEAYTTPGQTDLDQPTIDLKPWRKVMDEYVAKLQAQQQGQEAPAPQPTAPPPQPVPPPVTEPAAAARTGATRTWEKDGNAFVYPVIFNGGGKVVWVNGRMFRVWPSGKRQYLGDTPIEEAKEFVEFLKEEGSLIGESIVRGVTTAGRKIGQTVKAPFTLTDEEKKGLGL